MKSETSHLLQKAVLLRQPAKSIDFLQNASYTHISASAQDRQNAQNAQP